jgi:hypothetical protein
LLNENIQSAPCAFLDVLLCVASGPRRVVLAVVALSRHCERTKGEMPCDMPSANDWRRESVSAVGLFTRMT